LRDARGFEGIGPCVEVGPPEAPPAPPASHLPEHLLDRGVATCAVGTSAPGCQRQVPPHVVHLMKLDAEVGERAEQVRPPATGSVVAVVAAFHRAHARDALYAFV